MKEKTNGVDANKTKVITDKVRFSYLHVFEAVAMEGQTGDKKYSVSLIIPKKNKALVKKIRDAIEIAKDLGKSSKFNGKLPSNLKIPLRDGDVERPDDEAYKNCWFVTASSKTKPGLVDTDLDPIMSQDDLKSGDYGRASINFYPFNSAGNKGIACGLNNLMKLEDGEALSGRPSAEEDFGEFSKAGGDDDEDDDLI